MTSKRKICFLVTFGHSSDYKLQMKINLFSSISMYKVHANSIRFQTANPSIELYYTGLDNKTRLNQFQFQ